jgi:glycine dehydrogenase
MVEPTESESLEELDRFANAMLAIRKEIAAVEAGVVPVDDNVLKMAPHTAEEAVASKWSHPYSREEACFPVSSLRERKFWPPVARVDDAYGDRNLVCSCAPLSAYVDAMLDAN